MTHPRIRGAYLAVGLISAAALVGAATVSAQGSTTTKAGTVSSAKTAVAAHPSRFGFGPGQSLKVLAVYQSPAGSAIRFDRTYQGLPVIGGQLIVHLGPSGAYSYANGKRVATMPASVHPSVSAAAATAAAAAKVGYPASTKSASLVVYALGRTSSLAWQVKTASANGLHGDISYLSANSGRAIASWSTVEHSKGVGKTLYSGKVKLQNLKQGQNFLLQDNTRGQQKIYDAHNSCTVGSGTLFTDTNKKWGNYTQSSRESAGADAAFALANTWDFYLNTFGRHGIADDGVAARSFVHYCTNYANANWSDSCFCMIFGDGGGGSGWGPLVTIDVGGHEMSHGVTSRTAGLIYSGESGGLNESTSDVMGTMVEWYANSSEDVPDYMIGEEFYLDFDPEHNFLRRMDKPSLDGPSKDCWYSGVGGVDVHYSSGVGNHFFYLLSEGSGAKVINGYHYDSPTCDGSTVTGIGRDKAAAIWYKALTEEWVPSTNYHSARIGTLNAATALYGAGSPEYNAVNAAWAAVSVTP